MLQSAEIGKKGFVNFDYLRNYSEPNWSTFSDCKYLSQFDDIRKGN